MATATGTVKFVHDKGYGFIGVPGLSDVFFHLDEVGDDHRKNMIAGAIVEFEYFERYHNGAFKNTLDSVNAIELPTGPETHEDVWAVVDWYDRTKGLGFVLLEEPLVGKRAIVFKDACRQAEVIPDAGMVMKATVEKGDKGWKVTSFQAGPEITEESKRPPEKSVAEASAPTSATEAAPKKAKTVKASPAKKTPKTPRKKILLGDHPVHNDAMAAAFKAAGVKENSATAH